MALQTVLKALSDEMNRKILSMLKEGEMSASDIASRFDVTQSAVSQHLSALKKADLVRTRREGKYLFYELNTSVFEEVLAWISSFR